MRKPFYWKARQGWYVKSADLRSQIFLGPDEQSAIEKWAELQRVEQPDAPDASLDVICEHYLLSAIKTLSEDQYNRTATYLADLCNHHGKQPARSLKPFHVNRWIEKHPGWGPWSQRAAIAAVKRAFNWAIDEGLIERNPVARVKPPAAGRRETLITDDQHAELMAAKPQGRAKGKERKPARTELAFRQVMIALRHSGARPGTIATVTAAEVTPTLDAWVLRKHKTAKKTKKPLVVYLTPCLQTLRRILLARGRKGPLFVNSRGQKWTRNAMRLRMMRLRKKLGLPDGTVAYSYRHSFTTRMLVAGVPMATVAELQGHRDLKMLMQHYSHLEQQQEHLKAAAAKAVKKA